METHEKSGCLSENPSKGVGFTLMETHQKSGFHLSREPSKGVGFILVETQVMDWV